MGPLWDSRLDRSGQKIDPSGRAPGTPPGRPTPSGTGRPRPSSPARCEGMSNRFGDASRLRATPTRQSSRVLNRCRWCRGCVKTSRRSDP